MDNGIDEIFALVPVCEHLVKIGDILIISRNTCDKSPSLQGEADIFFRHIELIFENLLVY